MDCSMPGLPVHHQLPKFIQTHAIQTHAHWVGDAIQPSHPLPSPSPPAFNFSQHQRVFQIDSSSHQVDKILEFQPQHQYFQWIFRIYFLKDELDGSSCSPRHSAFIVQLSHPYMTTRKTIAFVSKVMSLLFNMLSRLVITFLLRSTHLLISWLQSPSEVILEPPRIKSVIVSIVSPSICHDMMALDAMILVFWMLIFKPTFSLSFFTFIKRLFSSSSLSAIRVMSSAFTP